MPRILFRRNTFANLPNVSEGEPFWATDTKTLYVGDGVGAPVAVGATTSPFVADLLDDADLAAFLTTLGLDTSLATLALPDNTTISAFGKTLVDDASADAALTTLGVSTFAKTILDDTSAAAVKTTLGIVTYSEYRISNYANIAAALTAIGATSATLIIDSATTLTESATFPATLSVEARKGGLITKASTYTIAMMGPFSAGLYQVFSGFAAGNIVFADGSIAKAYPQWWGGLPDNTTDCITAINCAKASFYNTHLTAGVWKITDEITYLTGTQGVDNYKGFRSLTGDGNRTIIRQVTADKNVLNLKFLWHSDGYDFWLEGMTVKDMQLIGEADTHDALYLEGVLRAHLENLNCIAGRYGINVKGLMCSTLINVKSSKNMWDENPVSGVTPAIPVNPLYSVALAATTESETGMPINANEIINFLAEGGSGDGMVLSDWHGNKMYATVEANGGTGIYMVHECIFNDFKFWCEGNHDTDLYVDGGSNRNKVSILCADDKAVVLLNSHSNRIHDSYVGTMDNQATCTGTLFDSVMYKTTWTDNGTASITHNLRVGATPYAAGTTP
jgi:hypothetical protein